MMLHTEYRLSTYVLWFQTRRIYKFSFKKYLSTRDLDIQQTGTLCIIVEEGNIRIRRDKRANKQAMAP